MKLLNAPRRDAAWGMDAPGNRRRGDLSGRRNGLPDLVLIAGIIVFLGGCTVAPGPETGLEEGPGEDLTIVTWNVQALFDGTETGLEYEEYRAAGGWSEEKYQARVTALSQAISRMGSKTPDILAFQELENGEILKSLVEGPLSKQGYRWTFFANLPQSSLGIGVISRFPLEQAKAHSITWGDETTPRPVLEARILVEEEPLELFVCHWKSKLGGDIQTEALRRASARVITRRIREIEADTPGMPIIIMGDLNENHDEFYRQAGAVVSALLPDDPKAAELAGFAPSLEHAPEKGQDFLVISRQKPPAAEYFAPQTVVVYSPWEGDLPGGSYNYKNAWETIDHFLLSAGLFDDRGWEFRSCETLDREPFVTSAGYPNGYNPKTGNGLSDHIPLLLTLRMR